ncbi:MAG TPA: permease [Candidatus Choladousia intestinavium]|uniref:Permease n=1 Tax=Candidatus Choladousia intestinavium TaxID=2840727 RepID=A0A9D1ABP9_9FIRM|nr:permease [Candidatus Choladousia intestinavium]
MADILHREFVYLWYYFDVQLRQIFGYWLLGILLGSCISVFLKDKIHGLLRAMSQSRMGLMGIVPASLLGIASPLCMYGTILLAASFSRSGMRDEWLASFMMCSILLNPQLIVYSTALGTTALAVRIVSCFLCGIAAGLLIWCFKRGKPFFRFDSFDEPVSRDTDQNLVLRLLKNIGRNIRATGPYFLIGVLLSALFQRYVPEDLMTTAFGGNEAFGVLMAATVGVPLYACGGTIPLLQAWLMDGMSMGSAAAFMITGPSTKITNLGALKIVLGIKNFLIYLVFVMTFSFLTGLAVNLLI